MSNIIGADDIEQLQELESDEFDQLCAMVGMDKKPFHVMRLKKALTRHTTTTTATIKPLPPDNKTAPTSSVNQFTSPSLSTTSTSPSPNLSTSSNKDKDSLLEHYLSDTGNKASLKKTPPSISKAFVDAMESSGRSLPSTNKTKTSSSNTNNKDGQNSKTVFLPPYLQEGSDCRNFDELIDDQTPVQKTLGLCPFLPSMWDPERQELIRKYSSIYGKNFNKRQHELLTPFEEQVNEGAYQLCLRDPTLLVRREELFVLAKRAVKEGGYSYYHGYSKTGKDMESTLTTTGKKRTNNSSLLSSGSSSKMLRIASDIEEMPKKLSGRMRQEKMNELERLISANKAQQAAKLVELEQAQQLCNFSAAFSIQLEVESLGNACQQLQSSYAALKRKQRRSDRYYNQKARENEVENDTEGKQGSAGNLSPIAPLVNDDETTEQNRSDFELNKLSMLSQSSLGKESSSVKEQNKKASTARSTVTAMVIPGSQGSMTQSNQLTVVSSVPENVSEGDDREVQDLVKNVSHATDEVNSLMIREFQKQLVWDL